ncbi:MAG: M3 family metallopeptidase [Candidatus Hodarchaeales archaeon]
MTNSHDSKLSDLSIEFEKYQILIFEQRYNQIAGLEYDKDLMQSSSETLVELSNTFLNEFTEPRNFYLYCISTIARARKLPLTLEIHENRSKILSTEKYSIHGKPVNWGSWRQFNAHEPENKHRKAVYDEFIEKAPDLAPMIIKRFNISKQVHTLYESSPLDLYLESEFIAYEKLRDFIITLGDGARKVFLESADHYAPEIIGKESFDYYDDFYLARGRIYSPLNKYFDFAKKNPQKIMEKLLSNLGFNSNLQQIKVDNENREKKSPSAFCFGIQIPDDVRVVYKKVSPFSDFASLFHEYGHAIHGTSGIKDDPFWKRYIVPMSVAETFSIFFEMLLQQPLYLKYELGLNEVAIQEILDRRHFMNLYFLVFYASNALMKIEYWKRNYSAEDASKRFQELTKRFFWEIPGDYWLTHHVMPDYDIYAPSYMLASVRVKEWMNQMIDEFGEEFWRGDQAKQVGAVIRDLAATRGEFDLSVWDMNTKPFLDEQSQFSFM